MAASTVGTDYAAVVQELYISYFGRPADYYGLTSFEAALVAAQAPTDFATLNSTLQAGTNSALKTLVNSFSSSAESTSLYGTGTDTISISKFVNAIYNNVLNRDADTSGLSFWVNAITSGTLSQADAAVAITAAATANTTAQGLIDAAVVANKVAVAGDFTGDLTTASQINGYSGDAAAAAARALLGTVSSTTDLVAFQATITSTIASIVSGTGTSVALTVGEDDLTGTSANDIYTAAVVVTGSSSFNTLTSLDVIDGGAGTNTLKATLALDTAGAEAPTLKNIQNVQVRFVGGELDLANATGVTTVLVANSTLAGTVDNVGAASTVGVSNQTAAVTFGTSTATTLNVALDTFGNSTTTGVINLGNVATTVNLTTNDSVVDIATATAIKTLTVGASGDTEITALDVTALASVTVTGTGTLEIDPTLTVVTKFDASGNSGGVTASFANTTKAISVVGSSGDDVITIDAPLTKSSVNLGAGDDVLNLTGVVVAGSVFDGGAGTNTLSIDSTTDLSVYNTAALFKAGFLDFTTLEIASATDVAVNASIETGFTSYVLDASAGTIELSNLSAATSITVDGDVSGILTLSTVSTVTDLTTIGVTLTLDNGATSAAAGVSITDLVTDAATLTIHSSGLLTSAGINAVTLDAADTNLSSVVIDGSQAISLSTGALAQAATIDASTATGAVTIDAHLATALININGGTAADTIIASAGGGAIYGGAGGDSITLGAGVDTVVYKAVTDSVYSVKADGITIGSGIDTITGFTTGTDKIDLTGLALTSTSVIVDKSALTLSALTTLAASSSFYNDSTGTARSVVEVTVGGDSYLFIDANKDHKFDASTDLVIKLAGVTSIAAADLIFG